MKLALRVLAVLLLLMISAGLIFYRYPLWVADQHTRFHLWREGVKSEYVEAGGYRLHYFEAGPVGGGGTPLVLVHGLGARGEDWGAMIPSLAAQGFHVYVPDLLGFGRSPKPDVSYSISLQEQTVAQFMQAVHVARADVGGWSMGGWVVMKLALDHPEMVDRLMVYDSAGLYFPATFGPELFTPSDPAGVRKLIAILTPKPRVIPDFAAEAMVRKLQANAWVVNRSTASMINGRDLLDFRLHNISQPMLIVWGAQDELIPLASGEAIHKSVPQSVLNIVEGCGHLAPAECAKPVVEGTVEFLRAQPPMRGGGRTFAAGY
ncbi:alpha/beta fold hydrolase [Tunturiibacter gelidoferens]|uniref:Pimeloyl-ACP methyl ester carboxylesterase n=1 Tax=Tunturiibacter lichenicola TaxID=2051959 RepID=A0A7Y9NL72_9BACT|nr:alpha/beta hydrolase [Edaphobacter lichenicola]NYF51348.1 pimeloyl-ACP methyl ester carboxylesterase [Edaphobacter lichenicola]